jgi:hypothetical protein
MKQALQVVSFEGALLRRGFWLYIWEITTPDARQLYYVGRTGDSSSNNAQSAFNRMSQHLGFNKRSNVLRRRLKTAGVDPSTCTFKLFAHGPIMEESVTHDSHRTSRDHVAAMEKALADAMLAASYNVINEVPCRKQLDGAAFAIVRAAFGEHFTRLVNHPQTPRDSSRATA